LVGVSSKMVFIPMTASKGFRPVARLNRTA
jgi:hypothetical protein